MTTEVVDSLSLIATKTSKTIWSPCIFGRSIVSSSVPIEPSLVEAPSTASKMTWPTVASLPASVEVSVLDEYAAMASVFEATEKP